MRKPSVLGTYYPASERALREALEEAFTGERGPGSMPQERADRNVTAVIVPHDPLTKSGPVAAWGYHALAASPKPDLYLLLAPNLKGMESGYSTETWETPLGELRADQHFLRILGEKGTIRQKEGAFNSQPGIEAQLPFLQSIGAAKIAPLVISADIDLKQLALDIKEALVEHGKTASFIVTSSLMRHGREFGQVRFSHDVQEQIAAFDKELISKIQAQDAAAFRNHVDEQLANMTGALAIECLLRVLKPCEMKLEQYYTSAELDKGKSSVSYAAIAFETK